MSAEPKCEQYLKDRGIEWREDSSNRRPGVRTEPNPPRTHADVDFRMESPLCRRFSRHTPSLAQEDEEYWRAEVDARAPDVAETVGETGAVVTDVRSYRNCQLHLRGAYCGGRLSSARRISAVSTSAILRRCFGWCREGKVTLACRRPVSM